MTAQFAELKRRRKQLLRDAIESGSYRVDPKALAGSILEHLGMEPDDMPSVGSFNRLGGRGWEAVPIRPPDLAA